MHNLVDMLRVVLCSMNGGHLSLHVHGDVRHLINELHLQHFDRFLHALSGGNLSLIRQISSFSRILRVLRSFLLGFKRMFLSPPILVQPIPGMNSFLCPLLVSNFKLGIQLFYDGCVSHRNAVIL